MSVMTPDQLRNGGSGVDMRGRPIGPGYIQPAQQADPQRQAVMDQLGQPPAQTAAPTGPVAALPGTFARGGKTKQLPGMDIDKLGRVGAATGAQVAGKVLGTTAAGAAAGAGINLATGALADKMRVKEDMPTFGGEFGDLTDQYGRRFEGTGGGAASEAVRWAGYGANPGLVAATGGLSVPIAALGGAIKAWASKNAPSAYTDFSVEDASKAIGDAYQKYLGRPASAEEINGRIVGQGFDPEGGDRWVGEKGLFSQLGFIRDSDEAKQFRETGKSAIERQALMDQMGGGEAGATAGVPAGVNERGGADAAMAAPVGGGGGGSQMGGFALEGFGGKLADGRSKLEAGDSPKYQIGRTLSQFDPRQGLTPEVIAALNQLGIGTFSGQGDKLHVEGGDPRFNGVTDIDVARDFTNDGGTGSGAWQFLAENGEGAGAPVGGGGGPVTSLDGLRNVDIPQMDGDTLARIQAELQRILRNEPNREAVMAGLQG